MIEYLDIPESDFSVFMILFFVRLGILHYHLALHGRYSVVLRADRDKLGIEVIV
jgi:hypothetical protein